MFISCPVAHEWFGVVLSVFCDSECGSPWLTLLGLDIVMSDTDGWSTVPSYAHYWVCLVLRSKACWSLIALRGSGL